MIRFFDGSPGKTRRVTVQPRGHPPRVAGLVSPAAPWSECGGILWIDSVRIPIVKRRGHWLLSRNGHWYWMLRSVDD